MCHRRKSQRKIKKSYLIDYKKILIEELNIKKNRTDSLERKKDMIVIHRGLERKMEVLVLKNHKNLRVEELALDSKLIK